MIARPVALEDVVITTAPRRVRVTHVRHRINVDAAGRSFGERVKARRERLGLTQAQLAEAAGLSAWPIHSIEWERGNSVQCDSVARIARALGCSIDALWYGETAS